MVTITLRAAAHETSACKARSALCLRSHTLRAFRRLLKKTRFYPIYKTLGHYPDYWYWRLRGRPTRIPHLVKQNTVLEFGKRYGLHTLVETGTYYGEMVAGVARHFKRIVSIEFDARLAAAARTRFRSRQHVEILEGSSDDLVKQVLLSLQDPALFWLDAGYFLWAGEHKSTDRLMTELDAIFRHPIPNHVVLVDDVVSWSGRDGTPEVGELEKELNRQYPDRAITVESGLMCVRHKQFI